MRSCHFWTPETPTPWAHCGVAALVALIGLGCQGGEANLLTGLLCGAGTTEQNGECVADPDDDGSGGDAGSGGAGVGGALTCGPGTAEYLGECVPIVDPNDDEEPPLTTISPPGGVFFEVPFVSIYANEPALIYFTTDGTAPTVEDSPSVPNQVILLDVKPDIPVRYLAVDLAGNAEEEQSETYSLDNLPPSPVDNLDTAVSGDVTVTWDNPTDPDFAGVVVLRTGGAPVDVAPVPGKLYVVGEKIGSGVVAYSGPEESFAETLAAGFNYYQAWAHDAVGNYSSSAIAQTFVNIAAQFATIEIADPTGNPMVSIVDAPANHVLVGEADAQGNGQVLLSLEWLNGANRMLFNPKLVLQVMNEGNGANADGSLGDPYWRYNATFAGLPANESHTRDLLLTGVSGNADPLVLEVRLRDDPMLAFSDNSNSNGTAMMLADAGTNSPVGEIACQGTGANGRCKMESAAFSRDGRFLFLGQRAGGNVEVYEMATGQLVQELNLNGTAGSVTDIEISPDGTTMFAVAMGRCHRTTGNRNNASLGIRLFSFDAASLQATGDVQLTTSTNARTGGIAVSPNGEWVAVPHDGNGNVVAFVDTNTLQVTNVNVNSRVGDVEFMNDDQLFAPARQQGSYSLIDVNNFSVDPFNGGPSNGAVDVERALNGDLWMTSRFQGVWVYDGNSFSNLQSFTSHGVVLHPNGTTAYVTQRDNSQVLMFSIGGKNNIGSINFPQGLRRHHSMAVTLF